MKKLVGFLLFLFFVPMTDAHAYLFEHEVDKAPVWNGEVLSGQVYLESYFYRIDVDEAATYTFSMKDPAEGFTKVIFYDEKQSIFHGLNSSIYDGDTEKTVVDIQLEKGTYYAVIEGGWYGGYVPYEVGYTVKPLKANDYDIEPNYKKELATTIPLEKTIHGTLSSSGVETDDYYKFTLNQFSKVTLSVPALNEKGGNLKVIVTTEDGYQVLDSMVSSNNSDIGKEYLPAGTYIVKVTKDFSDILIVPYSFKITHNPVDESNTEVGVGINNLLNNKPINGFIYNNSKTRDDYQFELDKTSTISILVESFATNMSFVFSRWDEKYKQYIQYDPEGGAGGWSPIMTATVPAGKYKISIGTSYTFDEEAPYTIRLQTQRFTDVSSRYLYYEQIESLSSQGIITGYEDGRFKPKNSIQRQHVFAMLSRIESLELIKIRDMKSFTDLNDFHPYYNEIKAFYEAGIIDGSGQNMNAGHNLTRAQLAKILVNTFHLQMDGQDRTFSDVKQSDSFYRYIQILASHSITTGSNGKFMPNEPVTREHFSVFLHRTLQAIQ